MDEIPENSFENEIMELQKELSLNSEEIKDLVKKAREVIDSCLRLPGVDGVVIYFHDKIKRRLTLIAHKGLGHNYIEKARSQSSASIQYALVIEGKSMYLDFSDTRLSRIDIIKDEKITALGVIPFVKEGKITGVLNITSHDNNAFSAETRIAAESLAGGALYVE